MKTYKGKANKIDSVTYARVVSYDGISYTLFSSTGKILLSEKDIITNYPLVVIEGIKVEIGDVVKIAPNGFLFVIYSVLSHNNYLFLTENCNNDCIMCPQVLRKNTGSYISENLALVSLLEPSPQVIGITGGEPTCNWDDLVTLVGEIHKKHPQTGIQLLTNGRIFSNIEKVDELVAVGGNNILFCIPLYSDDMDTHNYMVGHPQAFSETVDGLYNLARRKQAIELRNVITKANYSRLPQWAEWVAYNLPFVSHAAIMGMEPINKAYKNIDKLWIDAVDYEQELINACRNFLRYDVFFYIYNHQLCVINKSIREFCCKSISDYKIVFTEKCQHCDAISDCGGLFSSAKKYHSRAIHPLKRS